MRSKYKSEKIIVDGITFDSKDEAKYYEYLKHLKTYGMIENFELQPKFTLIPKFKYKGKTERAATYTLDFLIYNLDGTKTYVDVKGFSTQQGEFKFKLLKSLHPDMDFKWVARSLKYGDRYGWIDFKELQKKRRESKRK
ncbi:DUF1064 domain-containing protein [Clostridium tyrobutyricum]|uniref:DUF1064 domain-containing protein n=1 Tax=Clostridium tyrobutyricum TaxID=1519 RepID=UPI0010AA6C34|nr:DUF1064 domain-containing protein [Clostridium tyrobutyricum]MBV4450695.1 DUF1064 domain-containing protein [Clostridium tyrobutyricum]QCH28492.1 hypothetical protein EZN00_02096 [Clostridium tyrobutyricum]